MVVEADGISHPLIDELERWREIIGQKFKAAMIRHNTRNSAHTNTQRHI